MENNKFYKILKKTRIIFSQLFLLTVVISNLISCLATRNSPDLLENPRTDSLRIELFKNDVSKLNLTDGDTLVDIGSQSGFHDFQIFHFYPNKFFILEDVNKKYQLNLRNLYILDKGQKKYFKNNCIRIKGTQESIPLNSGMYKTILCRKTLHEFKNSAIMINELKRIMSPDGILIIQEVIPKTKDEIDIGCKMKHLTKVEIINLLSQQGLKLMSSDTTTWEIRNANEANMNILKFKK
jgi:Methyltransferase domain